MYDVVIAGGRCAGASLAFLLARTGLKVLVLDKASLPGEIINGNVITSEGVGYLRRWGLLEQIEATGSPLVRDFAFEYVGVTPPMPPPADESPEPGGPELIAPRRADLDGVLLDAAIRAGAEVETGSKVEGVVFCDGSARGVRVRRRGRPEREVSARFVVGADGRWSSVAGAVGASEYNQLPPSSAAYFGWWDDLGLRRAEFQMRPGYFLGAIPSRHGRALVFIQLNLEHSAAHRADAEGAYLEALRGFPSLWPRLEGARRAERVVGMLDLRQFFRVPWGPGWALVGDAGHHKDPLAARGISDAFRDAEILSRALVRGLDGGDLDGGLRDFHAIRDRAVGDVYRLNAEVARLDVDPMTTLARFEELRVAEVAASTYMSGVLST